MSVLCMLLTLSRPKARAKATGLIWLTFSQNLNSRPERHQTLFGEGFQIDFHFGLKLDLPYFISFTVYLLQIGLEAPSKDIHSFKIGVHSANYHTTMSILTYRQWKLVQGLRQYSLSKGRGCL